MPKNILVNNSGSYQPISASIDDNSALSSSIRLTINTASFVGQSGLMQIFNGQLIPVPLTSSEEYNPDGATKFPLFSGSALSYNSAVGFGPHRTETPQFSGDISGDLTSSVKVRNLLNITNGVLSSNYGGTSNSSYTANSIVLASGSGPTYGDTDKVVAVVDNNGTWGLVDKSILNPPQPLLTGTVVYLYTGSYNTTTTTSQFDTFTWIKPGTVGSLTGVGAKPKFIRVICQGAGGGGASGPAFCYGGAGGGYSDTILIADAVPSEVNCYVGKGGFPANGRNQGSVIGGGSGGSSSFGNLVNAYGGGGGGGAAVDAVAGNGYFYNGGGSGIGSILGGAGGGRSRGVAGGSIGPLPDGSLLTGSAGLEVTGLRDAPPPQTGSYFMFNNFYLNNTSSNTLGIPFPNLLCAGGGGGNRSTVPAEFGGNGASCTFGSGGGGGGQSTVDAAKHGLGGSGGRGYILIICS